MRTMTFMIDDQSTQDTNLQVWVTITENADGTLTFDVTQEGLIIGDLRGLFFDISDESLIGSLDVSGTPAPTQVLQGNDTIISLGGDVNMNGLGGSDGGYDVGIEVGTQGIGVDDIRDYSFVLSSTTRALTLEDFVNVDFGARLTSVGTEGGTRSDSDKILGTTSPFIMNDAPVAANDTNTIKEDATPNTVSGNVLSNDSDPDGNTLTVANAGTITLQYGSLVIHADGSYTYTLDNSNPDVDALNSGQHLFDTFTYTASDGYGGTASSTLTIKIDGCTDNRPPVLCADTNTIKEDATPNTVSGNVLSNDSDPDGNTLSVSNAGPVTLTYGSLVINADGSYTYTLDNSNPDVDALNSGQHLFDTFTYTASDGKGGTTSSTLTIKIDGCTDNRPPVLCADTNTIKEDATPNTVSGNVLSNDSDPDGNTLSVSNAGPVTLTYGSLVINADGSYTYTLDNSNPDVDALNSGQHLFDTFTYTASDGKGGTTSSTLTIKIDGCTDNRPPVLCADTNTIKEDATPNTVSGNVLSNDSDPDGNTLTVANAGTITLQYGSLVINADGSYTYTLDNSNPDVDALNSGQHLFDTFTYTASDGRGGTSSSTLTIRIDGSTDNRPPVAYADTISIKEDTSPNPVTGNVLLNDSDPDGNALTVTNAGTFTLDHGLLVIHADGTYTYTLDNSNPAVNALTDGQTLTDSFTYNISDGKGGTASAYLNVTINGTTDAPTCGCHCSSTPPGTPPGDYSTVKTTAGTFFADTLTGDSGVTNLFYSLGGNDNITGANEAINRIFTGSGNDTVVGGKNAVNEIYTEKGGIDDIKGGFHSINTLYGGIDANKLTGGDCSINTIFGGEGDATIHGGNNNSVNTMYAGGGAVTMNGGNDSTNTMYAEWGDGVVVTGGNNAINTFFDGGGNATYIGGEGDNLFVFNNLKYPTLSQGIQDNKVYPIALTNQDVTSNFEYVSKGVDTVHGNASSTENVIGLIGRLDQQTWTINLTNPADATLATDGSWVANTGQTLSGTITNNVNGAVVTFDTINKVTFLV